MAIGENSVIRPVLPVPIAGAATPVAIGVAPSSAAVVGVAPNTLIYADGNPIGNTRGHISPLGLGSVDQALSIRRCGLNAAQVRKMLSNLEATICRDGKILDYSEALYLNSSDDLAALYSLRFEGERILTVGGSGDCPQLFSSRGACQVDVADLSLPGLMYNELTLVAITQLSYEEYLRMFHQWKGYPEWNANIPLVDATLYQRLRPHLSSAARHFWDSFPQVISPYVRPHRSNRLRSRPDFHGRQWTFIGEIVTDESQYAAVGKRLRQTKWSLQAKNIFSFFGASRLYDTIYLSNVEQNGYAIVELSSQLVRQGHRRVLFSYSRNTYLDSYGTYESLGDLTWKGISTWKGIPIREVEGNPAGQLVLFEMKRT